MRSQHFMLNPESRAWRLLATIPGIGLFGMGTVLLTVVLLIFLWPLPIALEQKRKLTRRAISRSAKLFLQMLQLLGLLTYEYRNQERLVTGGQVVIANHPTLLDALFLMAAIPNATFIMKAAMTKHPFMAGIASLAGYLPNSLHGQDLIDKAVAALHRGHILVIFPEGTRTLDSDHLVFQRGAANIALQAHCPVQPVLIHCNPAILRKNEKWYKVPLRRPAFHIQALDPVVIEHCIDTAQPPSLQARELTRMLQNKLLRELQLLT